MKNKILEKTAHYSKLENDLKSLTYKYTPENILVIIVTTIGILNFI